MKTLEDWSTSRGPYEAPEISPRIEECLAAYARRSLLPGVASKDGNG